MKQWASFFRRQQPRRRPTPTVMLLELIRHIRGTDDIFGESGDGSDAIYDALYSIQEKAGCREITVFGRPEFIHRAHWDKPRLARQVIPPLIWRTHKINYMHFLDDYRGTITDMAGKNPIYVDIWFDEAQVKAAWP